MKLLIRNEDNVVIYAETEITLTEEGASSPFWIDFSFNTDNATVVDADIVDNFQGGCYTYIDDTWEVVPSAASYLSNLAVTSLQKLKAAKNLEINLWRAQANQTTFPHLGKSIACDALSRSDIDAVANSIALTGAFPDSFPMAWKAIDNSYIMLPTIAAFKDMHKAMTTQGTINFGKSQQLKAALAAATTEAQVAAIAWG